MKNYWPKVCVKSWGESLLFGEWCAWCLSPPWLDFASNKVNIINKLGTWVAQAVAKIVEVLWCFKGGMVEIKGLLNLVETLGDRGHLIEPLEYAS